ncbi:MAG: SDR family oxidoreductase [Acidimicrobiia bacterium]|nr:MAG: SDR family oxidoreductase [Acidimicrobiia bacterium]
MELADRVVVVTGGGGGIGAALARRFHDEGARGVVVADIDVPSAEAVADEVGGIAVAVDVSAEADNIAMIDAAEQAYGPVDLLCLNAGIATGGSVDAPDDDWQRAWAVNVMSHVYGTRAVLPSMLESGSGYLLHTASAAGLLTNLGAAPYSVTKHAVVALAEWLSITYGDAGIGVSCLAPQFVDTAMLDQLTMISDGFHEVAVDTSISTDQVADAVIDGLRDERFLILPHPEVEQYFLNKATDYERWLGGMRKMQRHLVGEQ